MGVVSMLEPGQIGSLQVRNRIINAPMEKNLSSPEGVPGYEYVEYVKDRARGGVGLIILEATYVEPRGKGHIYQLGAHSDDVIPHLATVVEAAHTYGARVGVHLTHSGGVSESEITGLQPVAPSAILAHRELPRELNKDEIPHMAALFGRAAWRAVQAGVDLIEIHGAHGYLIHQFFSPRTNKRTDEYGGSLENRMRFPLDVVKAVRDAVGSGHPLSYRVSAEEFLEGGFTIEDSVALVRRLEAAGINLIDVSAGTYGSNNMIVQPMDFEPGGLRHLAGKIKRVVGIPVSMAGRINSPAVADRLLRDGYCDFVTVGRALHADPEFVEKARTGRTTLIRPCIACYWCVDCMSRNQPVQCAVNPRASFEREGIPQPAQSRRKVVVVGGGPAGLEAACVAAERGHEVKLIEREGELGGQIRLSRQMLPEYSKLVDYYKERLKDAGVTVELGLAADGHMLKHLNPHVIILATGAGSASLQIEADGSVPVVPFESILNGTTKAPARAVVAGGSGIGCVAGSFLALQGTKVTVVEPGGELGMDVLPRMRGSMRDMLTVSGAEALLRATVEQILEGKVIIVHEGVPVVMEGVEVVVMAAGRRSNNSLSFALHLDPEVNAELLVIGDAALPRRIGDAVREGYLAGSRT